jgi:acyl-CoA reductase-like NAD-dependent aldehyde dehydrogenase
VSSTQFLIGGRWTAARSGETEEIRSPHDGSVVGEVPTGGPEALAAANGTAFGLAAGIVTGDVAGAVQAIRETDAGNIHTAPGNRTVPTPAEGDLSA